MPAKTLVMYSICDLLTYIKCNIYVFSGYTYFIMSDKKIPYHTICVIHVICCVTTTQYYVKYINRCKICCHFYIPFYTGQTKCQHNIMLTFVLHAIKVHLTKLLYLMH